MQTHTLDTGDADIVYDVEGELPAADGQRPLVMIGQPMDASGFRALATHFSDRTVVTYDPRGLGRSTRRDGETASSPAVQAEDLHKLVGVLGVGQVDVFASSGGAVTGLAWVSAHPEDVATLVAHEPPLPNTLADADGAERAMEGFRDAYTARGWGAGMAAFVAMTSWQGPFTDAYFAMPAADPAMFGMPADDNGLRDDPLLSDRSRPVTDYRLDFDALQAASTRIVLAYGDESEGIFTGRTTLAIADKLGTQPVLFPGGHGGFAGEDGAWPGKATDFAVTLHRVLAG